MRGALAKAAEVLMAPTAGVEAVIDALLRKATAVRLPEAAPRPAGVLAGRSRKPKVSLFARLVCHFRSVAESHS